MKPRNEIDTNRTICGVFVEIRGKLSKVLASVLKATRDQERAVSNEEKLSTNQVQPKMK